MIKPIRALDGTGLAYVTDHGDDDCDDDDDDDDDYDDEGFEPTQAVHN